VSGEEPRHKDRLLVRDLLVRGIVGLNEWERKKKQDILINLDIFTDIKSAGISDDVAETVNYRTITKAVIETVEESSFFLVEALATEIARLIIIDHGVGRVRVRVEKPGALRFARSVGVDIERDRGDFA
jgi:FolB domain-containing protein